MIPYMRSACYSPTSELPRTCVPFVTHVYFNRYTRMSYSLYTYDSFVIRLCFISYIRVFYSSHHEETQVSS